jgi:hypothetical protein
VRTWHDVKKLLATDRDGVKKLAPANLQMLALAQLVDTGKPVRADTGPRATRQYKVKSGNLR